MQASWPSTATDWTVTGAVLRSSLARADHRPGLRTLQPLTGRDGAPPPAAVNDRLVARRSAGSVAQPCPLTRALRIQWPHGRARRRGRARRVVAPRDRRRGALPQLAIAKAEAKFPAVAVSAFTGRGTGPVKVSFVRERAAAVDDCGRF